MLDRIPFIANILILVPVCLSMLRPAGTASTFEGLAVDEPALRLLVASLWGAILISSVLGLFWPERFTAILLLQVIYKAAWLALFVLPLLWSGHAWPQGISLIFAAIVIIWPFFIWRAWA